MSTTTTTTSHPPRHQDPIPLHPSHPIDHCHRVHRRVRTRQGAIHTRLVLQRGAAAQPSNHHPPQEVATTPTPTSRAASCYAFESVLAEQPKKGVTVFLATPMMPLDTTSICLVSCGPPVVIKVVPQPHQQNTVADNPFTEIAAMQRLMSARAAGGSFHPHLIPLLDCMQDEDFVYLVLPYLTGGDLYTLVEGTDGKGLPEAEASTYLRQMAEGLLFMKQSSGLAHHDVSLENVVLGDGRRLGEQEEQEEEEEESGGNQGSGSSSAASSGPLVAKVIDLGMCLQVPQRQRRGGGMSVGGETEGDAVLLSPAVCRGKPAYLSPEVVREEARDAFASDVWSLGVCLYVMLTGRHLYCSPDDHAFKAMARGGVRKVVSLYESYGPRLSNYAKDLVCQMLHSDPAQRPTLEEVLAHPLLEQEEEGIDGSSSSSRRRNGQDRVLLPSWKRDWYLTSPKQAREVVRSNAACLSQGVGRVRDGRSIKRSSLVPCQ